MKLLTELHDIPSNDYKFKELSSFLCDLSREFI